MAREELEEDDTHAEKGMGKNQDARGGGKPWCMRKIIGIKGEVTSDS